MRSVSLFLQPGLRSSVSRSFAVRRVLLGRGCLCGAHRARATVATTKLLHACACEGADENSWQSRPRHACALGAGLLLWTLEELFRGNCVICRTQRVIQGGDNGHVGRHCEVSPAPPCPELCCELRGLCRHSYFGPRTCGRSEKPIHRSGGVSIRVSKETFLPLNVQPVFSC